jgi:GNAT superfamily N-acetyltransferase
MTLLELVHGDYTISTDRSRLDHATIHRFLSEESYWAKGRPPELQARAIENSLLVIGAYHRDGAQVGFARMVTDLATWAWLSDVFVLADHRGGGLGSAMVGAIVTHPDVVDLRLQFLATADGHTLYAKFGYTTLDDPSRWMHRRPQS